MSAASDKGYTPADHSGNLKVIAGSTFMQGRRPSQEDRHVKIADFCKAGAALKMCIEHLEKPCSFFAVYDGHQGSKCAEFVAQRLHSRLLSRLIAYKGFWKDEQLREALRESFLELDTEFLQKYRADPDGCTAVLALVIGMRVIVAWVGDSRCIVGRVRGQENDAEGWQVSTISEDHKPNLPNERQRVECAGGKVIKHGGCYRVASTDFEDKAREIKRAQAQGLGTVAKQPVALAVSRSFGDRFFKEPQELLVATPSVRAVKLHQQYKFLVLMCDGITDVMSDQRAMDIVRNHASEGPRASVGALVKEAYERGSQDNLTAIVVFFRWTGDTWIVGEGEEEVNEPCPKRAKLEVPTTSDLTTKRHQPVLPLPSTEEALLNLSAKELKAALVACGADLTGCCEKADFIEKAVAFHRQDGKGPSDDTIETTEAKNAFERGKAANLKWWPRAQAKRVDQAEIIPPEPNNLSLQQELPDSEAGLLKLTVKDVKALLLSWKVDVTGCCEKDEFLEKVRDLQRSSGKVNHTPEYVGCERNAVEMSTQERLCQPSVEALAGMSAKELKALLLSHKVDVNGCLEKEDFLEKARQLGMQSVEEG